MPRAPKSPRWIPITLSISPVARKLLLLHAASHDMTMGEVVDGLIQSHCGPVVGHVPGPIGAGTGLSAVNQGTAPVPPTTPPKARARKPGPGQPKSAHLSIEGLRDALKRIGMTRSELALEIGIGSRGVSEWFEHGIPPGRQEQVWKILVSRGWKP